MREIGTEPPLPSHAETLTLYLDAFVAALLDAGVRHLVLAPGSRSTPLALLFARRAAGEGLADRPASPPPAPAPRLWTLIDERSAGYFALGLAKRLREAVAVLTTSGTAAANLLPAVVEAYYGRVPLLLLTADRPHEARDCGAPQTIDQIGLYGRHVKRFVEVAPPDASPTLRRYARNVAFRTVALAQLPPCGPVHLNFPLREPLIPAPFSALREDAPHGGAAAGEGVSLSLRPAPARPDGGTAHVSLAPRVLSREALLPIVKRVRAARRGLIVCGPQEDPALADPLGRLAERLRLPLLADPLSLVRCGPHPRATVIDAYDAFLRDRPFCEAHAPDLVLRFGAVPTSKPLLLYLERHRTCPQILVDDGDGWRDPEGLAQFVVQADPVAFCRQVEALLGEAGRSGRTARGVGEGAGPTDPDDGVWLRLWRSASAATRTAIEEAFGEWNELFEGRLFDELARLLPDGATLFVGSSMPVRDLDTFFPTGPRAIRFLANRGANGIDGVLSSALGAAAASRERSATPVASDRPAVSGRPADGGDSAGGDGGRGGPLVLVIGDLSFYHDLNGLLAAKRHRLDATVILVHNDGGGIFSFLPQAEAGEHFEELFGTPTGLDFAPVVGMYGGRFRRVGSWEAFRSEVARSLAERGLDVIELRSDRHRNVALHRALWERVSGALRAARIPALGNSDRDPPG